jgi:hypothetical protein
MAGGDVKQALADVGLSPDHLSLPGQRAFIGTTVMRQKQMDGTNFAMN